jgi:hypothetical protein
MLETVVGEYGEFHGMSDIINVREPEVTGWRDPQPLTVTAAEIGDEGGAPGPLAEALESILVRVAGATVTDVGPLPFPGDLLPTNELVVDDVLRVDDLLWLTDPFPSAGDTYDEIVGVLMFRAEHYALAPRSGADVTRAPDAGG